ncbi:MAG: outer membrane lipoprotein chaperone LolA [Gammaproteobacteria bacterium]|nr:outer membrane lipoprotein chaperone LolA [Gammaproteobacteria bacterium]MDH3768534.1 outer membrane lipoprotein chaperone LolA [Gammaproteobacteria bacterium]
MFAGIPATTGLQLGRLIVASLMLVMASAFAVEKPEAMTRVERFLEATDTLSAEFTQVLIDENGQVLSESQGTLSIKRPGRFRWHYTTPEELLVLGDGKHVWSYDVELENATVASQSSTLSGNPAALLAGDSSAAEAFEVRKSWRAGTTEWVELAPRDEQQDFRSVHLGFADSVLVSMELHDQLGQTTRIGFDRVMQNSQVSDELFVFTPPAGVDVINAGGFSP